MTPKQKAFSRAYDDLIENYEWAFRNLYIDVAMVHPKRLRVMEDKALNTRLQIWLESGPPVEQWQSSHDYNLDCGADTFEEAIVKLHRLVKKFYWPSKDPFKVRNRRQPK